MSGPIVEGVASRYLADIFRPIARGTQGTRPLHPTPGLHALSDVAGGPAKRGGAHKCA